MSAAVTAIAPKPPTLLQRMTTIRRNVEQAREDLDYLCGALGDVPDNDNLLLTLQDAWADLDSAVDHLTPKYPLLDRDLEP